MRIEPRWWLASYFAALAFFCRMFDAEINVERVSDFVSRWGFKYYLEHDHDA